jgi:excisionase family DNA binding protein
VNGPQDLRIYLTPDEAADVLRTTRKAIYVKIERRQLPGVKKIGNRILIRTSVLLEWIDQQDAHTLHGEQ